MTDWIMLLMLAIFGIIGYAVMGWVDRSISRHASDSDKPEWESGTDEPAENGKPARTYPRMPVFLYFKRKSHSRSF